MTSTLPGRALLAASLLAALGGCSLFKSNEQVLATINQRVIGMPAGDFFDRYGRPRSRTEMLDHSTEYDWISAVPYARPGVEGLDEHVCKLHVASDPRGRISRVDVVYDAPGLKSASRCGEIFAEK
ncbi:MAG TPA: hypothetical protein VH041_12710 [Caldimonas sp.]|jgi:hypothetical protein|nr:hypothetical protein [Caldimonas sp.]HEX4235154.1 hypothetical protein [Caldimonas sp.]